MAKNRLDVEVAKRGLVSSRSQAESYIRLGQVKVNSQVIKKTGQLVNEVDTIVVTAEEQYVNRAALKLKSADASFKLDFSGKTVLDVGSSTGGFTEYALRHGAKKVIAVDVGTDQLHPVLRQDIRIELHEKTDIRNVWVRNSDSSHSKQESEHEKVYVSGPIDIVVIDVSFISLREILPHISHLVTSQSKVVAMVKPQFEADRNQYKHKGVIKNDKMRRDILKDFEMWVQKQYKMIDKIDSQVTGSKGNIERFYLFRKLA